MRDQLTLSVTDPGFPQGGGAWTLQGGGVNTQFCRILPKTAWNWKNLDAEGGACVPHAPLRSATVYKKYIRQISPFSTDVQVNQWILVKELIIMHDERSNWLMDLNHHFGSFFCVINCNLTEVRVERFVMVTLFVELSMVTLCTDIVSWLFCVFYEFIRLGELLLVSCSISTLVKLVVIIHLKLNLHQI